MKTLNVKVEHIFHSSFVVETEHYQLVFDYYKGDISLKDKKTIVFVTHGHGDHYNTDIFKWSDKIKDIKYILSSDIKVLNDNGIIHSISPYEELVIDNVKIKTFGSTDMGISFYINVDNVNIFHAGDLNWWYWDDDSEKEKLDMENLFKDEIGKIKNLDVDIAFFPVDPRLESAFYLGGEYFIKEIKPKYFLPMHFGDNFSIVPDFIHRLEGNISEIMDLNHENQTFQL